jgi:polyhydroxyalkanoate synthase subunit PhaE
MSPIDYSKAFTAFWTAQGQALVKAQEQAGKAVAEGMKALASGKLPAMPEISTDLATAGTDLVRVGEAVGKLWSAATSLSGSLAKATSFAATAGTSASVSPEGSPVEATFRKMLDPRNWMAGTGEMDDVLGRMAEGPRFADLWEIERRYARVLQAWMNLRRRGLEHNAIVLEAWLQAGRHFGEELTRQVSAEAKPPDAKAALGLWTETANRELLETQRSEPFLLTQAAMIRATTELRIAQQELVEHFGKQYGFPTRTELDDVHRTVTELRREVRAMRRENRTAASAAPQTVSAAPPAPVAEHAPAAEHASVAERPKETPRVRRQSVNQRGTR